MTNRRGFLLVGCLVAVLGATVGCKSYKIDRGDETGGMTSVGGGDGGGGPGSASGGASTDEWCSSGEQYLCSEGMLQRCDLDVPGVWTPVERCATPELCDQDAGACRICALGDYRCNGFQLEDCSAAGDTWGFVRNCPDAEYCSSATGDCLACVPGEAFCEGATLRRCNETQTGWVDTQCPSEGECNLAAMACTPCAPGQLQCHGSVLQRCTDQSTWEPLSTCLTSELCAETVTRYQDAPDAWSGECEPPRCELGSYRCNESDPRILEGCLPGQVNWGTVAVCSTAALCNSEVGQCNVGCSPGEYRCDGVSLQVCSIDGTGYVTEKTCQSEAECNTAQRDCVLCAVGEYQCNGVELQVCSAAREWELVATCASSALCSAANAACAPPGCPLANEFSCEGTVLRRCSDDLVGWVAVEECSTAATCNAVDGRCDTGCGEPGVMRCVGQELERCSDDGTAWQADQLCDEGWLCNAVSGTCDGSCPNPPYGCQNSVPVACQANEAGGVEWVATGLPCATPELCHSDTARSFCNEPVCGSEGEANHYRCNPNNPQLVEVCNAGRTGWELARACETGATCDAEGSAATATPQCDICLPGALACDGAVLRMCAADGQALYDVRQCQSPDHCHASSDGSEGYCYVCAPGDQQCQGPDAIAACAPDRLGFVSSAGFVSCPQGCVDLAGNQDYCAACPVAGEAQCTQTGAPGAIRYCDSDRRGWGAPQTCSGGQGCTDYATSDYCIGCTDGARECTADSPPRLRECQNNAWTVVEQCSFACYPSGNADYCGDCAEGASECTDGGVRTCVGGRWAETQCAAPFSCHEVSSTVAYCGECSANQSECVDQTHRRVCSDLQRWGDVTVCENGCYDSGAADYCGQCAQGSAQCTAGASGRVACVDGNWVAADCSASAPYCADSECVECLDGTTQCSDDGTITERCVGGQWTTVPCGAGQVCLEGACADCNTASSDCDPEGLNGSVTTCNVTSGEWETVACEAPRPYCADGACVACLEAERRCDNGDIDECVSGQWQVVEDCVADEPCDPTTLQCRCADNSSHCTEGDASVQICVDGQWVTNECDYGCLDGRCLDPGTGGTGGGGSGGTGGETSSGGSGGIGGTGGETSSGGSGGTGGDGSGGTSDGGTGGASGGTSGGGTSGAPGDGGGTSETGGDASGGTAGEGGTDGVGGA